MLYKYLLLVYVAFSFPVGAPGAWLSHWFHAIVFQSSWEGHLEAVLSPFRRTPGSDCSLSQGYINFVLPKILASEGTYIACMTEHHVALTCQ